MLSGYKRASSIYSLACRYYNGDGVRRDWGKKAHDLAMIAASLGYAPAVSALGSYYDYGIGVQRDPSLAFRYYVAAVEAGEVGALVSVGACYAGGIGVRRNWRLAFRYFNRAVRHRVPYVPLPTIREASLFRARHS